MVALIQHQQEALAALCRRYGVRRLDLFGSAATGAFRDGDSDIDFVATFDDTRVPGYADRFLAFADALEALFGHPVDLLTERSIQSPSFRREVEATRRTVYERRSPQAAA